MQIFKAIPVDKMLGCVTCMDFKDQLLFEVLPLTYCIFKMWFGADL